MEFPTEVAAPPSSPRLPRGRRCRLPAASPGRHAATSPSAVLSPSRNYLLNWPGRRCHHVRAGISWTGEPHDLARFRSAAPSAVYGFSRRVPTRRDDADDVEYAGEVSALTLMHGRIRHVCSSELARRRSWSTTLNDHRSTTRRSISRTCANCPWQTPTDTARPALTTVRCEPRWPIENLETFSNLGK